MNFGTNVISGQLQTIVDKKAIFLRSLNLKKIDIKDGNLNLVTTVR